jgi:hypothetical protein
MDEATARTKWCPFARVGFSTKESVINRSAEDKTKHDIKGWNCIGSKCMAWRSLEDKYREGWESRAGTGYCGLAGKPHGQ